MLTRLWDQLRDVISSPTWQSHLPQKDVIDVGGSILPSGFWCYRRRAPGGWQYRYMNDNEQQELAWFDAIK